MHFKMATLDVLIFFSVSTIWKRLFYVNVSTICCYFAYFMNTYKFLFVNIAINELP